MVDMVDGGGSRIIWITFLLFLAFIFVSFSVHFHAFTLHMRTRTDAGRHDAGDGTGAPGAQEGLGGPEAGGQKRGLLEEEQRAAMYGQDHSAITLPQ